MVGSEERPILLVTRPGEGATRFAEAFRARFGADWPVILSPLMQMCPLAGDLPGAGVLIFTSQHAVSAFAAREEGRGRRAYCVGRRTAEAARAAGFDPITGAGDARALASRIIGDRPAGLLLHARGEEVAFDLAKALNSAGIETKKAILYRQEAIPPSPEAQAALAGVRPCLVPLFSPNAARRMCDILPSAPAPLLVAVMSEAVAAACRGVEFKALECAARPDEEAMLDALATLLQRQNAG
ncbi:uroporphyrinogen-III synthase [Thioclava atlantica]|uniref:Uroporphyrinogen-III synthase n=1 Tax=Thioclava atlantica TaxID=1317124 RepID=A0A085TWU5_9RHOB|nr:uroporphyrinogen-III synthase [Thioclava atlantica]KFE35192.1 uroporphyrinogen-III synthase [Thioclava atlantica]